MHEHMRITMPHIHTIVSMDDKGEGEKILEILERFSGDIRCALAETFGYNPGEVALIVDIIEGRRLYYSANLMPLEFVIDIGAQPERLNDDVAKEFADLLTKTLSDLEEINFGLWIREMGSNGFYESPPYSEN